MNYLHTLCVWQPRRETPPAMEGGAVGLRELSPTAAPPRFTSLFSGLVLERCSVWLRRIYSASKVHFAGLCVWTRGDFSGAPCGDVITWTPNAELRWIGSPKAWHHLDVKRWSPANQSDADATTRHTLVSADHVASDVWQPPASGGTKWSSQPRLSSPAHRTHLHLQTS